MATHNIALRELKHTIYGCAVFVFLLIYAPLPAVVFIYSFFLLTLK